MDTVLSVITYTSTPLLVVCILYAALLAIRNKRQYRELNEQIRLFSEQMYSFDEVHENEVIGDSYLMKAYSKDNAYLLATDASRKLITNTTLSQIISQHALLRSYRSAYHHYNSDLNKKQSYLKSLFLHLEETKFKNKHQVMPVASDLLKKEVFDHFVYFSPDGEVDYRFESPKRQLEECFRRYASFIKYIDNKPWLWNKVLKSKDFSTGKEQAGYILISEMMRSFVIPEHIEAGVLKSGYIGYKSKGNFNDDDFFINTSFRLGFLIIDNVLNNFGNIQYQKRVEGLEKTYQDAAHILKEIKHDMNTNLSTIQSLAHRMVEQDDVQDRRYLFERINYSGIHLSSFLLQRMDLDNITKKGGGDHLTIETSNVKIINLIKETSLCFSERARAKNINFLISLNDKVPDIIRTHSDYIIQIIYNLLNNAFKYTDSGMVIISVSHKSDANMIEISISDTGVGIPKDATKNIFDKYYRAANVTEKGAGIGLSICKMNIEALGGSISVSSELGYGSQFTINLPASNAHCLADTVDEPIQSIVQCEGPDFYIASTDDLEQMITTIASNTVQEIEQMVFAFSDTSLNHSFIKWIKENVKASLQIIMINNYKPASTQLDSYRFMMRYRPVMVLPVCVQEISILMIDDMPEIINFWSQELLNKFGYHVDTATTYQEALDKLSSSEYDIILSDFNLDDEHTGLDILQKLRHEDNTTPFIFLTADDNYAKINACIASGAHKVLRKPLQIETLSTEIKNALEKLGYVFKETYINTRKNTRRRQGLYRSKNNIEWSMINTHKIHLIKAIEDFDLEERADALINDLYNEFKSENVHTYRKIIHKIKNIATSFYMSELKAYIAELQYKLNRIEEVGDITLSDIRKEHEEIINVFKISINLIISELKRGA